MYISAREVADTRDHTLHNLLAASTACIEAGERLVDLFIRTSREAVAHGTRQLGRLADGSLVGAPTDLWFNELAYQPAQVFEEAFDILGSTHTAVVQAAQQQIGVCDRLMVTAIDRAAQHSPWEGELALAVVKNTLKGAGNTLHSLTNAAIQSFEMAETQVKQASARQGAAAKPAPRLTRGKKTQ